MISVIKGRGRKLVNGSNNIKECIINKQHCIYKIFMTNYTI